MINLIKVFVFKYNSNYVKSSLPLVIQSLDVR